MAIRQHRHLGVYGVCRAGENVLLIRKARGPYVGQLDLPGGGIEFGEAPEAALQREFMEETGLVIASASLQSVESKVVRYVAADRIEEELHHLGLIFSVDIEDSDGETYPVPKSVGDGEDSRGAAWVRITDLDPHGLTPFARIALLGESSMVV